MLNTFPILSSHDVNVMELQNVSIGVTFNVTSNVRTYLNSNVIYIHLRMRSFIKEPRVNSSLKLRRMRQRERIHK